MSTIPDPADADAARALEALRAREPLFHRPEFGTTRADFEAMIVDDFRETGASGRCYDRACVLGVLERRHAQPHDDPWETSDLHCRALGARVWLLTYPLRQDRRLSRRMTLWREGDDGWRALYHQGTLVQETTP